MIDLVNMSSPISDTDLHNYYPPLKSFIQSLNELINYVNSLDVKVPQEYFEELNNLKNRVTDLETNLTGLVENVNTNTNTIDTIINSINNLTSQLSTINSEISTLNDLTDSLLDDIQTINSNITAINSTISQMQTTLNSTTERANYLYNRVEQVNAAKTLTPLNGVIINTQDIYRNAHVVVLNFEITYTGEGKAVLTVPTGGYRFLEDVHFTGWDIATNKAVLLEFQKNSGQIFVDNVENVTHHIVATVTGVTG